MSNEITLIGRNGWEIMARFDGSPENCTALYTYADSVPDIPGIVWEQRGDNTTFRYATNPAKDFDKVCDAGYQAHSEEQDWLDTGKWPGE